VSQHHLRQLPYSGREVTLPPFHPEINDRPPAASRKAVPVVALGVDPKARVVVVVEGAQAEGAARRRFQVHVLADELQHRHPGLDPFRTRTCEFLGQLWMPPPAEMVQMTGRPRKQPPAKILMSHALSYTGTAIPLVLIGAEATERQGPHVLTGVLVCQCTQMHYNSTQ